MSLNLRNIIKPYPSPIITGRGIDLDFPMLAGCLALLGLGLVMLGNVLVFRQPKPVAPVVAPGRA